MFDYAQLEALATIVEEGGFDKAASKLFVTQSAVSQRVRALEDTLGQLVLVRKTPPEATNAGQQLIKHFRQVSSLESSLQDDLQPNQPHAFSRLSIGVNADSLETWFMQALKPLMKTESILIDLSVADQEYTHQFLKEGRVVGCVSTNPKAMKGCDVTYLGKMTYHLLCTRAFQKKWFPKGLTRECISSAPLLTFDRVDELQHSLLQKIFGTNLPSVPSHYIPSPTQYFKTICAGLSYGMLPRLEAHSQLKSGKLINLAPSHEVTVELFWHRWSIRSEELNKLSDAIITGAKQYL